jgi:hypothetical protein
MTILDPRRARSFAIAAGEAPVKMHLSSLSRLLPFEKFFNQVNATARAIELIA